MRAIRTGTPTSARSVHRLTRGLIAGMVLVALAMNAGVASADSSRDHRNAENTFTKWRTAEPGVPPVLANMAGLVGGDVGDGTFKGEALSLVATDNIVTIDAIYHFSGSKHSFTASVHVVQTGTTMGSTSVISGRVSAGWLEGNLVAGGYTLITCEQSPGVFGTCFQGTLDILRGSKSAD